MSERAGQFVQTMVAPRQKSTQHRRNDALAKYALSDRLVQRTIEGVTSWEAFAAHPDGSDAEMLRPFVEVILTEDRQYSVEEARDTAMERAMGELDDEMAYQRVRVRLADLIPQLDRTQHAPHLVHYNTHNQGVSQLPGVGGGAHYRQDSLEGIAAEQNLPEDERARVEPIFFERIPEHAEGAITTGDGRHRIATYAAMGEAWILAEVTGSQRTLLVARGIAVQDA